MKFVGGKNGGTGFWFHRSFFYAMETDARILWIEGNRTVNPLFVPDLLDKGYHIETVSTGSKAVEVIPHFKPHIVIVNAASLRTSGTRICRSINEKSDGLPILLIADRGFDPSRDIAAEVILVLPFTTRKLVNRITPLLPGDDENVVKCGPISLDLDKKRVYCQGRESNLTPKLVNLLKSLMDRPNKIIKREDLFREIWETEYVGDTRTLDVHISWLRKAIEQDPRSPKYLLTIRSIGYRLNVA